MRIKAFGIAKFCKLNLFHDAESLLNIQSIVNRENCESLFHL